MWISGQRLRARREKMSGSGLEVDDGRARIRDMALGLFATEVRAWYGLEPLAKIFWLYGVAASTIVAGIYLLAMSRREWMVQEVLLGAFGAYTVWILVSVWRCAENADRFWGLLARSLTVAWAGNAAMVLLFQQIDLLTRVLRG